MRDEGGGEGKGEVYDEIADEGDVRVRVHTYYCNEIMTCACVTAITIILHSTLHLGRCFNYVTIDFESCERA